MTVDFVDAVNERWTILNPEQAAIHAQLISSAGQLLEALRNGMPEDASQILPAAFQSIKPWGKTIVQ